SAPEKIKATFALGVGSNFSTMGGLLVTWVLLTRTGWIEGFWNQILYTFLAAPVFMGDAINAYALGRIRLDTSHGWDDIQITDEGRHALSRLHPFWRGLSFATAASLAGMLLVSYAPVPSEYAWTKLLFPVLLLLHSSRCLHTIHAYISPRMPSFGGASLVRRAGFAYGIGVVWIGWLLMRQQGPETWWGLLFHGIVFFMIMGWLQPLPSKFSVFRPGGSGRSLPRLVVEPLQGRVNEPAISGDVRSEAGCWQSEHGFTVISDIRMPLLEMPLFESTGTALAASDASSLLLILQSEVRGRPHRTLVSWADGKAVVTTDFGATTARFPAGITYTAREAGELPSVFLAAHNAACSAVVVQPVPMPPWQALQ
ncbi:MAG TPA: hypothetical protein PKM25_19690, partial [Candidatus Ozemobacteraceae bacterium]|nr:hypothetical protein [Candidatus Ozemobacteraceae bacterium]